MSQITKGQLISLKMYKLKEHVNAYIIDCIDGQGYDLPGDALITTEGKLRFLHDTFLKEYGWHVARYGKQNAFKEYLQGLPSCFNIAFTNHDILELAYKWESLSPSATDKQKDKILENYFNFIAVKTFQLFKKFKIS